MVAGVAFMVFVLVANRSVSSAYNRSVISHSELIAAMSLSGIDSL